MSQPTSPQLLVGPFTGSAIDGSVQRRSPLLTEADAISIWMARWLRIRPIDLCRRYGCDPRRLYEIWEGIRHPAARDQAKTLFLRQYPTLSDRVDFGRHRRLSREANLDQLPLFIDKTS